MRSLLEQVRSNTNNPPVQTSRHAQPEKPLAAIPEDITHVYTRQHKAVGLQPSWEGPFRIESRPSRSTVQLDVGTYKNGEKRLEIRHFNDLKLAHPDSPAGVTAVRPKLGRPSKTSVQPNGQRVTDQSEPSAPSNRFPSFPQPPILSSKQAAATGNTDNNGTSSLPTHATSTSASRSPALTANEEFEGTITGPPPQPAFSRPVRSTRNPNPYYVDSFGWNYG